MSNLTSRHNNLRGVVKQICTAFTQAMVKTRTPLHFPSTLPWEKQNAQMITSGVVVLTIAIKTVKFCIISLVHRNSSDNLLEVNLNRDHLSDDIFEGTTDNEISLSALSLETSHVN